MNHSLLHYLHRSIHFFKLLSMKLTRIRSCLTLIWLPSTARKKTQLLECRYCKWHGGKGKEKKRYMYVEGILERELFCPECNQYIGFHSVKQHG
jgi:hypothetical protein